MKWTDERPMPPLNIKRYEFEMEEIRIGVQRETKLSQNFPLVAAGIRFNSYEDYGRYIADQFSSYLLAKKHTEVVDTFKYPADWWQHFKLRWFPQGGWLLKRWPVVWQERPITVKISKLCGHHDRYVPHRKRVCFEYLDELPSFNDFMESKPTDPTWRYR